MSAHQSAYTSKAPDAEGFIEYTADENAVWADLFKRQIPIVEKYACQEYVEGIKILDLPADRIPQLPEVNKRLMAVTGWQVEAVPALIPEDEFFGLLANKRFPAATFIRTREDFDYIKEPDMFHEVFGHCPMITHSAYADFLQHYGEQALAANPDERLLLQRLFWFTLEFGLIQAGTDMKVYGGGILSSVEETPYSIDSSDATRKPFNIVDILRTPYRIDIKQPVYFVLDNYDTLFNVFQQDIKGAVQEAKRLGEFQPTFTVDDSPCVHINCC